MIKTRQYTSFYTFYRDFVCVCVSGEPVPRSLEGLFVYEERSTSPPANDTIVVEQWTVIEVCVCVCPCITHVLGT